MSREAMTISLISWMTKLPGMQGTCRFGLMEEWVILWGYEGRL